MNENVLHTVTENGAPRPITALRNAADALYFKDAAGVSFRLIHEGTHGWRLQANRFANQTFCEEGASQSLARYMEEDVVSTASALTVTEREDALCVYAPDGTAAHLSLKGRFSLSFCDAAGKCLVAFTDVILADGKVRVLGELEEDEGVFGGGERFDVVNKRGTRVDLYTSDGWNKSDTTYLVIPLFLTTRKGGVFFNHFEPAVADFGCEQTDRWSYTMESDALDCYVYATGKFEDLFYGYAELSGHAQMPEPWMHGVQICRNSPDMVRFDEDFSYDTLEELPDYENKYLCRGEEYVLLKDASDEERAACDRIYVLQNDRFVASHVKNDAGRYYRSGNQSNPMGDSVKTIIQKFIDADMKPDAAIMEGIGWSGAYFASEDGARRKADIKSAVEWLHANGMKAMVYIRVGGANPAMEGCKPEYKVHADVEVRKEDGSIERIENTTAIPWMLGKADNPDVGKRGDGTLMTDDYLDITNEEALEWYFDRIWADSIEFGIDGVKIDFCECMPDGDKQYPTTRTHYLWKDPTRIQTGVEHHSYASYFISRFYRRMCQLKKEKQLPDGFMVLSRGGGIGSQRSPYLWAGDQVRTFEKLDDQLMSVVNAGLSGVPFMTYDMAGYHYTGKFGYFREGQAALEAEVFSRAVEFTAFTTNIQTHGDVRHVYDMDENTKQIYRIYTRLHRELIPYISEKARLACETGMPIVRHPVLHYPEDRNVYDLIDEFMLCDALLVAPILQGQTFSRDVYLPAGNWRDLLTDAVYTGGKNVRVSANIGQIPVFLNLDSEDAKTLSPIFEGENWKAAKCFG